MTAEGAQEVKRLDKLGWFWSTWEDNGGTWDGVAFGTGSLWALRTFAFYPAFFIYPRIRAISWRMISTPRRTFPRLPWTV